MQNIILTLHNILKPLLESHERIELILAYSGGIDSQVMLHALSHLSQQQLISNQIIVSY
jgi:tRNA(Ile)-lysidine synthase